MAITAKVRVGSRVQLNDEVDCVQFHADYADELNKEWAYYTPALHMQMNVRRSVPFEPGKNYTLTFEEE